MSASARRARRGALLAIVAALLLANPLYLGLFVDEPRPRSPTGYAATAVDLSNPEDRRLVVRHLGDDEIVDPQYLAESDEQQSGGSPTARAAAVLRTAVDDGNASVQDERVAFAVQRIVANHEFVVITGDGAPDGNAEYHRIAAEERDGATVVTTTAVDRETVARFVAASDAVHYRDLPGYQRETVEKVLAAGQDSYRPYNDEFHELTDALLVRNDTRYVFQARVHVDDFGFGTADLVGGLLSLLGVVCLLVAAGFTALAYRGRDD